MRQNPQSPNHQLNMATQTINQQGPNHMKHLYSGIILFIIIPILYALTGIISNL